MRRRAYPIQWKRTEEPVADSGDLLSGLENLENNTPAFSRWLFANVETHLGRKVLDAGAGVGTYTRLILESGRDSVALEPDPAMCVELVRRVGNPDGFRLLDNDLTDPAIVGKAQQ